MNTKVNLQTILIVLMVCLTVLISAPSFVKAQEGGPASAVDSEGKSEITLDPVPGGPGFIMVSPADLTPVSSAIQRSFLLTYLYNPSASVYGSYITGVNLPHGATINKLTIYCQDNAVDNLSVTLYRDNGAGQMEQVASVGSNGLPAGFVNVSTANILHPVIDNQNYSYTLIAAIPANYQQNLILSNIRIDYEYTGNLPLIMR